jgi:hypothetical protein
VTTKRSVISAAERTDRMTDPEKLRALVEKFQWEADQYVNRGECGQCVRKAWLQAKAELSTLLAEAERPAGPSKAECDECPDCGPISMCGPHSRASEKAERPTPMEIAQDWNTRLLGVGVSDERPTPPRVTMGNNAHKPVDSTPTADPRAELIAARNGLMAAIVKLRGGHAATMDDCDEAMAVLDIAIGKAFTERPTPPVVARAVEWAKELQRQYGWESTPPVEICSEGCRCGWYDTAAQHARNEDYYRGLVDECAKHLGPEVFIADDGTVGDSVLRAKVPELVAALAVKATPPVEDDVAANLRAWQAWHQPQPTEGAVTRAKLEEWQDIATAPKDGRSLLLWSSHWRDGGKPVTEPVIGRWSSFSNCFVVHEGEVYKPTHWTPLPLRAHLKDSPDAD